MAQPAEPTDQIDSANPALFSVLMASISHLTPADRAKLEEYCNRTEVDDGEIICDRFPFGYWVVLPETLEETKSAMYKSGMSGAIITLCEVAFRHGAVMIQLDQDGPISSDLQTYGEECLSVD